ncbi:putative Flavin-containing monooxygenase [Vibrio nigripulchritudo SO65]|uniref:flavin-containing monooxygenase n=1 Tax=Vibrio nigripulchritudo TaxID=28173 RepID=UPI0003B21BCE|nr:NAD(P)/FAD-dependent oxidoreductase [Vibrio nigripulchritudo]CCN36254.1 putative Flavin-containing monooxygenase [Vibrio nigripulchritudo AM115]CCN39815.1 putative Flavin-containing monooxygenase [Vibrio nigripulchritudo FTn2]CCN65630.1 putative Flavin-containing monooxygenase [Vibrio nigripulchritudo POn4]CCN74094.1 putative Flavin-containing monooxygenase [Vibrio nigripulchritudo SO65]
MEAVAIIGGGPSGIVAARYLQSQGFKPEIYESHSCIGGQWAADNPKSGVWPTMRTNTARMVTRFSDLDHDADVPIFPRNDQIKQYLTRYLEHFGLARFVSLNTSLRSVDRLDNRWKLTFEGDQGIFSKQFDKVVIATGAFNRPNIPVIKGLDTFSGECGSVHAFHYKDPEFYRGKRVLIAGGNISSLEIASDLAMLGASKVITTMRRQRYIMPKLVAGVPVESYAFTRGGALFQEQASSEEWAQATREFILTYSGNPAWYGAPEPDQDVRIAGTTGSQNYLNLVAEGRITCKPWIEKFGDNQVHFLDGSHEEIDGVIFGTGYRLNMEFFSDELKRHLEIDGMHITLADHTFSPKLPGMAFMGQWGQIGPYFPVLEQQARYIAYSWGKTVPVPEEQALIKACQACKENKGETLYQHLMAIKFARLNESDPSGSVTPLVEELLNKHAVTGLTFRLAGTDALDNAYEQILEESRLYGIKPTSLRNE